MVTGPRSRKPEISVAISPPGMSGISRSGGSSPRVATNERSTAAAGCSNTSRSCATTSAHVRSASGRPGSSRLTARSTPATTIGSRLIAAASVIRDRFP
jgi:hypothetical protein